MMDTPYQPIMVVAARQDYHEELRERIRQGFNHAKKGSGFITVNMTDISHIDIELIIEEFETNEFMLELIHADGFVLDQCCGKRLIRRWNIDGPRSLTYRIRRRGCCSWLF